MKININHPSPALISIIENPKQIITLDAKRNIKPPEIIIHEDSLLTEIERILRDSIELKIAALTKYDPLLNNKDDRGEVKSLSFIAVKGLLYFAAHDNNAIQLIEKSEEWSTGLLSGFVYISIKLLFIFYRCVVSQIFIIKQMI